MTDKILDTIASPADLADLSYDELDQLAFELRAQMVAATSVNGGHLASSLGAVELIIAMHRVFNCPEDKIVFDVGHQSYAHKLLTGRKDRFSTLRTKGGLSGFTRSSESPYDAHDSGHASDSLSVALGYALARDLEGGEGKIAAFVGDAAFTGGMATEALNNIGHIDTKLVIVLNDNGMSISSNVGSFAAYLASMRMSSQYINLRDSVEERVKSQGRFGRFLMNTGNAVKDSVKQLVMPGGMFFEEFGFTYLGPIDGHDIATLEPILRDASELDGPVIIHAVTTKGKGYTPAEKNPGLFHGVGPFDISTGEPLHSDGGPSWTEVFSEELASLASDDEDIVAITAAMEDGTGLAKFDEAMPDRFFDVGIAEEHAVTLASGLAAAGKKPVVAIYSTFLQRAFDQIAINVGLSNRHVVFAVDRAGLVGADGPTHHGSFDLSYLRMIPNMKIMAPSTDTDLRAALRAALELDGPAALRYPRGTAVAQAADAAQVAWEPGVASQLRSGDDGALLAVGDMVHVALGAAEIAAEQGCGLAVWDMRWVKPIDVQAVVEAAQTGLIVTLENNSVVGGFGSAVLETLSYEQLCCRVERLGLPDAFVAQGPQASLLAELGLDAESVAARAIEALSE